MRCLAVFGRFQPRFPGPLVSVAGFGLFEDALNGFQAQCGLAGVVKVTQRRMLKAIAASSTWAVALASPR